MESQNPLKKTIELWEGHVVEVNDKLFDDFDFMEDFSSAVKNEDISLLREIYMAVVGGESEYLLIRKHIEDENDGVFSLKAFNVILEKIGNQFPKAGNRAQRRSWKTPN